MDVQARIAAKAQIKSVELRRDSIIRNMRWRSRMLETDVSETIAKRNEQQDPSEIQKLCENSEFPYFVRRPIDTYIVAHQTGIIEARISGIPKPEVKCFKNWQRITDSPRIKMHHYEPDTYVLEIQDAISSDMGLYTFVARNCYGCITSSATVRIVHLEIEEYPRFLKRLQSTDVVAGHNGRLEATVTGSKPLEIKWFKNWIPLREDNHIEIRHYDPDSYVLNINNAEPEDSGLYTCKARNDAGVIHSSAMIHVEGNENLYTYKFYVPRPYGYLLDADWSEDLTRIRRRLQRLSDDLRQKDRDDLLHKRALANYHVKYRRQSYDYYDLF